ncbi:MAG: hypothetical protein ACLUI3_10835 [Christensenellales bacterium]
MTSTPATAWELARKRRLEPIIDMIRQHHGDTPVMYFYAKAVKMLGGRTSISAISAMTARSRRPPRRRS